jgi:hypothetical protein
MASSSARVLARWTRRLQAGLQARWNDRPRNGAPQARQVFGVRGWGGWRRGVGVSVIVNLAGNLALQGEEERESAHGALPAAI